MAEVFPLDGFEKIGLRIVSGVITARSRGGLVVVGRSEEARWAGTFTTDKLRSPQWHGLMAFLTDCVDRNLRVDFIHPRHVVPAGYNLGTWPVVADPSLVAVTHRRAIVVSGLTIGVVLKRGTRFSLMQGGLICHRVIAVDTVVASGVAQSLQLTPRLPIGLFSAGAIVRFKNPPVRLAIVPDSFSDEEAYAPTPITFGTEEALA